MRAGFDECHGSDICNDTNWANVQRDARAPAAYTASLMTMTMQFLIGNMVLIARKHTAGLSISWKVLVCIQVLALVFLVIVKPIPAFTVPAQGLRATANEVDGYPTTVLLYPCVPLRLYTSPVSRDTVLRNGRERQGLRQQPGGADQIVCLSIYLSVCLREA